LEELRLKARCHPPAATCAGGGRAPVDGNHHPGSPIHPAGRTVADRAFVERLVRRAEAAGIRGSDIHDLVEGGLTLVGCAAFDTELQDAVPPLLTIVDRIVDRIVVETIEIGSARDRHDTLANGSSPIRKVIMRH